MKIKRKKEKKIRTVKFPIIPSRDITFVTQARHPITGKPDDIVACIYLGYVPRTRKYVHVHVYRFDCAETAAKYVRFLNNTIAQYSERLNRIEMDLVGKGEIDDPRMSTNLSMMMHGGMRHSPRDPGLGSSDGMSEPHTDSYPDSGASTYSGSIPSDEIEPDMISLKDQMPFDSVTDELKLKLGMTKREGVPLLLPPKDYDTIRRKQGNLEKVDARRCLNVDIVGESAWTPRPRNSSEESGVELPSPSEGSEPNFPESGFGDEISSPISERDAYVYPAQSARSPRVSKVVNERDIMRVPSFSSAYSSHSYRSATSSQSNGYPEVDNGIIYMGRKPDADIPPADYDYPGMDQENLWGSNDFNRSLPAKAFPRDVPEYAVINKKRATSTNTPPRFSEMYSPRDPEIRIRRVNSMYK